mmetsp:Transcript_2513/g.7286  ORF Transcript_2513/g.7286 Transcript_2513/m.7286 type:complete len:263 (-) Transcript_2513:373-1161(-)
MLQLPAEAEGDQGHAEYVGQKIRIDLPCVHVAEEGLALRGRKPRAEAVLTHLPARRLGCDGEQAGRLQTDDLLAQVARPGSVAGAAGLLELLDGGAGDLVGRLQAAVQVLLGVGADAWGIDAMLGEGGQGEARVHHQWHLPWPFKHRVRDDPHRRLPRGPGLSRQLVEVVVDLPQRLHAGQPALEAAVEVLHRGHHGAGSEDDAMGPERPFLDELLGGMGLGDAREHTAKQTLPDLAADGRCLRRGLVDPDDLQAYHDQVLV